MHFAMTLGCPWYDICLLLQRPTLQTLFSLAYPFSLMSKTLLFLRQIVQVNCLRTVVKKTVWYDLVLSDLLQIIYIYI